MKSLKQNVNDKIQKFVKMFNNFVKFRKCMKILTVLTEITPHINLAMSMQYPSLKEPIKQ